MKIPMLDLGRHTQPLKTEIEILVSETCASGAFAGGPRVTDFENAFAGYLGAEEVVAVSTGTAALHLTFRALGLGPDDEVVVPTNSFIATAEAVVLAGARPVFCDVEPDTALASRRTMEAALTDRTRALCPVHLYGQVVEMDPILELASERGLRVVEDAAQAHGARHSGHPGRAGSFGDAGCFSFYPTKNLGSIGEGGAVAVRDPALAERIRQIRDHGQSAKHVHAVIGDNARMHAIQAGTLSIKLPHLDDWNQRRREIADRYRAVIEGLSIGAIEPASWSESVHHQFVIRVPNRDAWAPALAELGVPTAIYYPTPIHLQPAFRSGTAGEGSLPVAEALAGQILSIPMFAELTDDELDHVIDSLARVDLRLGAAAVG